MCWHLLCVPVRNCSIALVKLFGFKGLIGLLVAPVEAKSVAASVGSSTCDFWISVLGGIWSVEFGRSRALCPMFCFFA